MDHGLWSRSAVEIAGLIGAREAAASRAWRDTRDRDPARWSKR